LAARKKYEPGFVAALVIFRLVYEVRPPRIASSAHR
jgi:hypothetical protein